MRGIKLLRRCQLFNVIMGHNVMPITLTPRGDNMSIKSINVNVSYWFQSTGLTGQNLTEQNSRLFNRVQTKFRKKGFGKLSKMKCYHASRIGARMVKDEFGSPIGSNSKATFARVLTGVDQWLNGSNNIELDFRTFEIETPTDLACDFQR